MDEDSVCSDVNIESSQGDSVR